MPMSQIFHGGAPDSAHSASTFKISHNPEAEFTTVYGSQANMAGSGGVRSKVYLATSIACFALAIWIYTTPHMISDPQGALSKPVSWMQGRSDPKHRAIDRNLGVCGSGFHSGPDWKDELEGYGTVLHL